MIGGPGPRVISVAGLHPATLRNTPDFAYVGRAARGWPASVWGNPFRVGMARSGVATICGIYGVDPGPIDRPDEPIDAPAAVEFYRQWLARCRPDLVRRLPELRGRVLGCWCGAWSPGQPGIPCHAVVLCRLANP